MFVAVHHDNGGDVMVIHQSPEVNQTGVKRGLCDDELLPLPDHITERGTSFSNITLSRDTDFIIHTSHVVLKQWLHIPHLVTRYRLHDRHYSRGKQA